VFFFASEYAQIALGKDANGAGLFLIFIFIGFASAAQVGGRLLAARGAKRPVVLGCLIGAVGFWLWGRKVTGLSEGGQAFFVILSGAGLGMMVGPASTDAINRASRLAYGEATGITQTVRNYAAALGLAILGSVLVSRLHSQVTSSLVGRGIPRPVASAEATRIAESRSGETTGA